MAISNHDRPGMVLELLKCGLGPFVECHSKGAMESRRHDGHLPSHCDEAPRSANKRVT